MMLKPSKCDGCVFRDKGEYFTPDTIVEGSKVLFIGQNPGSNEEAGQLLIKRHWQGSQYTDECVQTVPQPLIGITGQMFDKRFLPLSGLQRSQVSVANAIRCRPGTALGLQPDGLPSISTAMKLETSDADIVKALKHCRQAYLQVPSSVQLIVTMGRHAQFAMTGIQQEESEYGKKQGVLESWRGYAVDYDDYYLSKPQTVDTTHYHDLTSHRQLLMTMHIAALFRDKKYFHATLQDFYKIKRLLAKQWPTSLPQWHTSTPMVWPSYSAFDTEYVPSTNKLIRWSLCDTDYNLYCVESDTDSNSRIPINPHSTVLIQNALADINHLVTLVDMDTVQVEDMMLAHSVLWTGEPHSLNYIASLYGAFNRYKHLAHETGQEQLYSALDAYEPMWMWQHHFIPAFKQDAAECAKLGLQSSWHVYKRYRLPLIHIINKAQLTGAKVNTARLNEVQRILQQRIDSIKEEAQLLTGDSKFNIGGRKQMLEEIYND